MSRFDYVGNATTHGKEGTRVYDCWVNMKQRCQNPKSKEFIYYGGRGIRVCDSWKSFKNFYASMGEMPEGSSIERIDVNGDYKPENCKWISRKLQSRNTRITKKVTIDNLEKPLVEWCENFKISHKIVLQRISRDGMSALEALTTPFRGKAIRDDQLVRNSDTVLQEERTDS